jgi:hypothetical protein
VVDSEYCDGCKIYVLKKGKCAGCDREPGNCTCTDLRCKICRKFLKKDGKCSGCDNEPELCTCRGYKMGHGRQNGPTRELEMK